MLCQIHFPLNGEQLRRQGNLTGSILKQNIHSFTDSLKVPCQPVEIKTEQTGKYQKDRQQNDRIHMAAKCPLVQLKRRIILHSKSILKKSHHPIGKITAQQSRICDIDYSNGSYQHTDCPEENLHAELTEIFFIFQSYSRPPILF